MNASYIITELGRNKSLFKSLLFDMNKEEYLWKPNVSKWCALEVVCHLIDEEVEDFRARVQLQLECAGKTPQHINPEGWVQDRGYIKRNFKEQVDIFLEERTQSLAWLKSLKSPNWDNYYVHPKYGNLSAGFFLTNWLAHDYLHIRQLTKLKYDYMAQISTEKYRYAGKWIVD